MIVKNLKNKIRFQVSIIILLLLFLFMSCNNSNEAEIQKQSSNSITRTETTLINDPNNSIENTKKCLIDYDWMYPSANNPTNAWKFLNDGTFNYSTTMFGGMSAWGNWHINSPGKISVSYTRSTEGRIPDDKTLTMPSCSSLEVGSTTYIKK